METSTSLKLASTFTFTMLMACIVGCTSPKSNQTNSSTDDVKSEQIAGNKDQVEQAMLQPCYLATIGKDTAQLEINEVNGMVTGKLNYMFAEKDSNYGEIKGKLSNDTISVDYTFKSEGMVSVRELTFIVRNSQIVEGVGEYISRKTNNKMVFKNSTDIDYTGKSFIFLPVECNNLK